MKRSSVPFAKAFTTLFALYLLASANSCSTELPFGSQTLTSENVQDPVWINESFPEVSADLAIRDSTFLSISVSRKKVMEGFLNAKSGNVLDELLRTITPFRSSTNQKSAFKYSFYDGGKQTDLITSANHTKLFETSEYYSDVNNLHRYFQIIGNELQIKKADNTFYMLVSDGETIIGFFAQIDPFRSR